MKISKLLNKIDEKSRKKYENTEYLENMKGDIELQTNRKKIFISLFAASLVLMIVAISLICTFYIPKKNPHFSYNEIFENATLEEINSTCKDFQILELNGYRMIYVKTIDKDSKTLLSYVVTIIDNKDLTELQLRIVVNENFHYAGNTDILSRKIFYDGYSMQYYESIDVDDGLYSYISRGYIYERNEKIYIAYNGFGLVEDSGFTNLIGQVLKLNKTK